MILTDLTGCTVPLGRLLGRGGEACVFSVTTNPTVVAKVYTSPSAERTAKLQVMLATPPADPMAARGHVSICWPATLLFDHCNVNVGFLMHRVDFASNVPVFSLYNPQDRQRVAPGFTWQYLLRTARNIASAVEALHARGYVVGDLNESNILVANSAMVTVVDCDSIQVPQPGTGAFFRCPVGKADYTPPELQGCDFGRIDRVEAHDNFALAVLIFQLLMEGTHPFGGVWQAAGDSPSIEARIRLGASPYIGASLTTPMPGAPSFGILASGIQALFETCFRDGHHSPHFRPTPREWRRALTAAETTLLTCRRSPRHIYSAHLTRCPWCDRTQLLGGVDPFSVAPQRRPVIRSGAVPAATVPRIVPFLQNPLAPVASTGIAVSPAPRPRAFYWLGGVVVAVGILFASFLAVRFVEDVKSGNQAAERARQQAATQAAEQARRAEVARIAERQRVAQGILGQWSGGQRTLTVTREGDRFRAEVPVEEGGLLYHHKGAHVMHGTILVDNQLRLANDNNGKLVDPSKYFGGDFSNEAWIGLSPDGSFLSVRFSEARTGSSIVMNRSLGVAGSSITVVPEAETDLTQLRQSDEPAVRERPPVGAASIAGAPPIPVTQTSPTTSPWPTVSAAGDAPAYADSVLGRYVIKGRRADYVALELKRDRTFVIDKRGMVFRGRYTIQGHTITMQMGNGQSNTGRLNGNAISEADGIVWVKEPESRSNSAFDSTGGSQHRGPVPTPTLLRSTPTQRLGSPERW